MAILIILFDNFTLEALFSASDEHYVVCNTTKKDNEQSLLLQRFRKSLIQTVWRLCVLLKALPPVCMKYTAQDESRVANIARGEAECYIFHKTLIKSCILSYKQSGSVLSVLLHFTLTEVSAKYSSLVILTHSLNK